MNRHRWAYGLTTVPERLRDLLPRTLASLTGAGFGEPRLFVDGCRSADAAEYSARFGLDVTSRWPRIRTYGNWILGLAELYIREPAATRYAMFQDDFVTYRNLRQYLDGCHWPEKGYLNLYTFPSNQRLATRSGWFEGREMDPDTGRVYHGKQQQAGRGAVGLCFPREAVVELLKHQTMVVKPMDAHYGHRKVDGAVVQAMNEAGWREYVHNPSLVQHTGKVTTMGSKVHKLATSFRGTDFDAMQLLGA